MKIRLLNDGGFIGTSNIRFPVEVDAKKASDDWFDVPGSEIIRVGGCAESFHPNHDYIWFTEDTDTKVREPYAYEVTTNRGHKYLVYARSTEYDNAVMFGYELKPLYQEVV